MGRNDSNIAPFWEHTKCRLSCTAKGDWFPGTEDHVVTTRAFTDEALAQGVQMAVQTLQEVPPQGQNGEYRLRVILPSASTGESLRPIQQRTGIKVSVEGKTVCGVGPEADQMVTLSGRLEGMQAAVAMTMDTMKQLKGQPWFSTWVGRQNTQRVMESKLNTAPPPQGGMAGGMMGANMGGCHGNIGMPNMGGVGGCSGGMGMGNMG